MAHTHKIFLKLEKFYTANFWFGIIFVVIISLTSQKLASITQLQALGLSTLTIAIIVGIIIGNISSSSINNKTTSGVDFSKNTLLRLGIILYGFRITLQQVISVGWSGMIIAIIMVCTTFYVALFLGTKIFKLDKQTTILIGAGSSICGAAAILAAEPIVKGQAHKVSVAVSTVVVFGTLSMFLYPLMYPYLNLSAGAYGIYAGSTIHEVAQVVVAGKNISDLSASTAVIEKMIRVMLLAPFLIFLSLKFNKNSHDSNHKITIPWFAVFFIIIAMCNSAITFPTMLQTTVNNLDTFFLTMAMAALGLKTHIGSVRQAGLKPLLLAGSLFIFLICGGYFINLLIQNLTILN